jgi:hypothetical protein
VDPDHWVYFEAPLQIGICFWLVSEFPDVPDEKRVESLRTAISHTESVLSRKQPQRDPDDFVKFIILRAAGNLIFYMSHLIRGVGPTDDLRNAIEENTHYLVGKESWDIVQNQVRIIDSIMFGATSIGNLKRALEMAKLNSDNFKKILHERPLQPDEREMWARAMETEFLMRSLAPPS